jgi:hypothetical protein
MPVRSPEIAWSRFGRGKRSVCHVFPSVTSSVSNIGSAATAKPRVESAKRVRNLLVHFTPGRDGEAFDSLSLSLVEGATVEIERSMTDMESSLGLARHSDTEQLSRAFIAALGTATKEVSSNPSR